MQYVDPTSLGVISQIGYLVLFLGVSGLTLLFRPVKRLIGRIRKRPEPPATQS